MNTDFACITGEPPLANSLWNFNGFDFTSLFIAKCAKTKWCVSLAFIQREPLAKAKPNQINAEQATAVAASAKARAPVDQNSAAKTVVPSDPTGGMVNLRA